ncbi:pC475L [African swine fever virus]|uniref:PC475L n=1 Tax=African swine fever virus TaxID=10497 RepID=A0A8A1V122_ASF|nr:pC475L [African swine fever virus]
MHRRRSIISSYVIQYIFFIPAICGFLFSLARILFIWECCNVRERIAYKMGFWQGQLRLLYVVGQGDSICRATGATFLCTTYYARRYYKWAGITKPRILFRTCLFLYVVYQGVCLFENPKRRIVLQYKYRLIGRRCKSAVYKIQQYVLGRHHNMVILYVTYRYLFIHTATKMYVVRLVYTGTILHVRLTYLSQMEAHFLYVSFRVVRRYHQRGIRSGHIYGMCYVFIILMVRVRWLWKFCFPLRNLAGISQLIYRLVQKSVCRKAVYGHLFTGNCKRFTFVCRLHRNNGNGVLFFYVVIPLQILFIPATNIFPWWIIKGKAKCYVYPGPLVFGVYVFMVFIRYCGYGVKNIGGHICKVSNPHKVRAHPHGLHMDGAHRAHLLVPLFIQNVSKFVRVLNVVGGKHIKVGSFSLGIYRAAFTMQGIFNGYPPVQNVLFLYVIFADHLQSRLNLHGICLTFLCNVPVFTNITIRLYYRR